MFYTIYNIIGLIVAWIVYRQTEDEWETFGWFETFGAGAIITISWPVWAIALIGDWKREREK